MIFVLTLQRFTIFKLENELTSLTSDPQLTALLNLNHLD